MKCLILNINLSQFINVIRYLKHVSMYNFIKQPHKYVYLLANLKIMFTKTQNIFRCNNTRKPSCEVTLG